MVAVVGSVVVVGGSFATVRLSQKRMFFATAPSRLF